MQKKQERERNNRKIGQKYEDIAAEYLTKKGYQIVKRNYRNPYGEIDILAQKDGVWIFCEVKFRSTRHCGSPLEAVDVRKQRRISKAAFYFYAYHGYAENTPCRFDVIAIYGDESVVHIENAFEFQGR